MADTNPKKSLLSELRQLKEVITETADSLHSQNEILRTRGMNLPPATLQGIRGLTADIDTLETNVLSEQTELGQLRSLAETSAMINTSLDLDDVLNRAMDVVINLTGAERGYIILRDTQTGLLDYRVRRESEVLPQQATSEAPQISQTILNEVVETGQPLLADNAYKDERLQSGMSIAAMTLRSVLCVPLKYKDVVIGVVYVDNRLRSGVFEEREKILLAAFANQASVAIENARLYEGIQRSLLEIREMKDLMDNVFASIGSGIITTDAAHRVLTFNRAASLILMRDPDETIGHKLENVLPGVSADLNQYLAKVREQDAAQVMDAEMEVVGRGRIAVSMKLSPLKNATGTNQGVTIVIDDLTEQRDREETLNLIKRYLPPEMVDNIHAISQLALGGERREVTCMFVETRPVSSFPPEMRPQQIMEQLNIYFDRATRCIHEAEGVIDKYMGTEIMVLFNTQLNPMEDHALRALKTALQIREAFLTLYAELGIDPDPHFYRIGMNTGIATLGNVGSLSRREFSAIGDTINLSKRLEENATSGQLIIGEATYAHLHKTLNGQSLEGIRFEEREPVQVKGRQQKTRIYEVFKS
ncbi:MAG: hypothetical protein OHK0046_13640 [Anaerolineae bacterium]